MLTGITWYLRQKYRLLSPMMVSIRQRGLAHLLRRLHEEIHVRRHRAHPDAEYEACTDAPTSGLGHLLVIDAISPDPTRDSGSVRLLNILRIARELGWRVTFMPDRGRPSANTFAIFSRLGIGVIPTPSGVSLVRWIKRKTNAPDAIMLCRHDVAKNHYALMRNMAPKATIIFDTVDLHHLRESRMAQITSDEKLMQKSRRTQMRELQLISDCDVTFVVSAVEQQFLRQELPEARIELLSNIHQISRPRSSDEPTRDLLFVGGLEHPPNRDGVRWMIQQVMPLVREALPDIVLHVIGNITAQDRQTLEQPSVQIHGHVENLEPHLFHARIAVAPLRFGAGVKGKVNTAMSYGVPVVATSIASEGMLLSNDDDVLVADTAEDFARAILRLCHDRTLWQKLSRNGQENVRRHFSPDVARQTLKKTLTATIH